MKLINKAIRTFSIILIFYAIMVFVLIVHVIPFTSLLLVIVLITIATLLISIFYSYSIIKPVERLNEQIKKIADSGGMIGVNFCPRFLSNDRNILGTKFDKANHEDIKQAYHLTGGGCSKEEFDAGSQQYYDSLSRLREAMKAAPVSVEYVADHIDHMVNVGGIEAVGLGSDYDGIALTPDRLDDCSKMPNLTAELEQRGYKDDAISTDNQPLIIDKLKALATAEPGCLQVTKTGFRIMGYRISHPDHFPGTHRHVPAIRRESHAASTDSYLPAVSSITESGTEYL